jgi:phosphatidylinositol-3,4,5-trisphosphate 3-phosphatase/dual-specificity protein phosphatase PTEN
MIRGKVSKEKNRINFENFDLDGSYITDRIFAVGFPAEGFDEAYRNRRVDVIRFLTNNHGSNVKIYNLCIEKKK